MSAALAVAGVSKRFGRQPALVDVSFELAPGSATALLGVNGAGKSTLLRAVLDLVGLDAGDISLYGIPHREARARAPLAYLGERFLPPHVARGGEVLTLLCELHGVTPAPAAIAAECAALGFDPGALSRPARDYSKGMLQKLGLMACLLAERPLLILDEPMSGLDVQAHALIARRLDALRATGTTLLFSTHTLADVATLCDRALVLRAGHLVFDDTVAALRALDAGGDLERAFLGIAT